MWELRQQFQVIRKRWCFQTSAPTSSFWRHSFIIATTSKHFEALNIHAESVKNITLFFKEAEQSCRLFLPRRNKKKWSFRVKKKKSKVCLVEKFILALLTGPRERLMLRADWFIHSESVAVFWHRQWDTNSSGAPLTGYLFRIVGAQTSKKHDTRGVNWMWFIIWKAQHFPLWKKILSLDPIFREKIVPTVAPEFDNCHVARISNFFFLVKITIPWCKKLLPWNSTN